MEKLKDEVVSNIRACLISVKGRVSVRQLENDYRTILGERIPYSKLGYQNLNSFMMNIPSLMVTSDPSGELYVDAKLSEKSNHIADMVKKQKSVKEKSVYRVTFTQKNKWNPPNGTKSRPFKQAQRPAVTSHNQFVTRSPAKREKYLPSKVVVPEHSTFNNIRTTDTHSVNDLQSRYILPEKICDNNKIEPPLMNDDVTPVKYSRLRSSNCSDDQEELVNDNHDNSLTLSSKKRIRKRMSELSLNEDSTHIDQPADTTFPPKLNIDMSGNNLIDLENLAKLYKLGAIDISIKPMRRKKAPTLYNCRITVDGEDYLSYPKDFLNEESATQYCAKKALDKLIPKCIRKKIMLLSTDKDVKNRIPPLLRVHFQGIWSWQVEADYIDQFVEQLPSNWLEIIDSLDCVAVEKIQDKFVLRYCRPGTALQKGKNFPSLVPFDISVPSNTVQFGEDNRLFGQIKCIMSLNEIWCCQWETNESAAYNEMCRLMSAYYDENNQQHKASTIQIGSYYIANADDTWYRIKSLEIKDNKVNCFLIDHGDEYILGIENLYQMRREFATSPAQAFLCRLAGLEDLYDADFPLEKLDSFIGKEVLIESVDNTDDADAEQSLPVVMYDVSDNSSINEELLRFVTTEIATPRIKESIQEVYVTHITDEGDVYVQVRTKAFTSLDGLLQTLSQEIAANTAPPEKMTKLKWQATKEQLYLHKDNETNSRIKITDMSPDGKLAQIEFIDRGNYAIVKVSDVVFHPLEKISDILHKFPAQSVRVRMDLESIPSNFVDIATKLMKLNAPVLLKVLGSNVEGTPLGEFYRRSSEEEGLFCINKAIMMEVEIISNSESSSSKSVRSKLKLLKDETPNRENVPSGGSLQRPILPQLKEYFEVHIPFAVNPWNFFVQPYESRMKLNKLMEELQEYSKHAAFSPLQVSGILPGQIYAIKHSDDIWYRISILKVIHAGSISVFYCDFGYYSSVSVNQLVPLDPEFLDLPYQALKAKLSGIKPKKSKWTMEDCDHFIELVKDKSFVSVLMDVENDELYESDAVLKLILIDTSSQEDVLIESELIKKGIAVQAD